MFEDSTVDVATDDMVAARLAGQIHDVAMSSEDVNDSTFQVLIAAARHVRCDGSSSLQCPQDNADRHVSVECIARACTEILEKFCGDTA